MAKSKKKKVDNLDDVFLDAINIPQELSAKEVLSEEEMNDLEKGPIKDEAALGADGGDQDESGIDYDALEDGLHVFVAEDAMSASLVAKNSPAMEVAAVKELLQKQGVVYGLKEKAIANAVTSIKSGSGWKGELVVAKGFEPGLDQLMDYPFLKRGKDPSGENYVWMTEGVPLFFDEIKEILSSKEVDVIKKTDLRAKAVNPYEVIATLKGDSRSVQGYDVLGKPVGDLLTAPEAGKNVDFDKDEGTYTSETFGYLVMTTKSVSVMPPIWVPPDLMKMYYVNLKQAGTFCFPYPENIQKMLTDHEVHTAASLIESIEKLSAAFQEGKELPRTIKIAEGIYPIPGRDSKFEFLHDTEVKAGKIREDDSIDLKERNLVTSVGKGTLLAEKLLPTKGTPGKTIFGSDVTAKDGEDIQITINEHIIEKEKEDGVKGYYAKTDGNVSYSENNITVEESFGIEGDIDYSTGNIVVKTGLTIGGSVCPDFSVKASGNTIINGSVELGASVFVEGNLTVKGGVIGENTKVIVIGSLEVGFIQDAEIVVKGDLVVENYIFNGTVRASGEIRVKKEGGSMGGKIIGGYVCASTGIDAPTIGSSSVRNTVVAIQADPVIIGKKQKLEKDIVYCDENISKMLRTLQLKKFDPEAIKKMLAAVSADKKDMLLKILNTLKKFVKHRKEATKGKTELETFIDQCLKKSKIRVAAEFFEGNRVEIGSAKFVALDDMGSSVFQLQDDKITY